jgi:hypothetical protein
MDRDRAIDPLIFCSVLLNFFSHFLQCSELFFDLVYVTIIARLGDHLREDLDLHTYLLYFMLVFVGW